MELTSYARGRRSFSRLTSSKFVPDVLKSFLLLLIFILKETSNRDISFGFRSRRPLVQTIAGSTLWLF